MTGSMPDLYTATQIATPTGTASSCRQPTGAKRTANSTPNSPTATASGTTDTWLVYTVAITMSATTSSITAIVRRVTRRRVPPGAIRASTPSTNAVSVDIAAPQPL